MNMLAHRHLPPTPQDAAIARVSGQALSRFAATRGPLKLRVTDAEQMEPIELPAGAVALLMEVLEAMAAGRGVTIIPAFSLGRTQSILYEMNGIFERLQKENTSFSSDPIIPEKLDPNINPGRITITL